MALGENQNKIQYTVTTSDDSFEFPYKYWDSSEIVVTKLASGIETNPTFTISPTNGDSENGGTVTLDSAVTSCTITIERIVAYASEADYQRGALSPTSLTENFDKAAAMSQQLEDRISRSLNVPTTDPAGLTYDIGTVEVRKNTVLGFDANGNTSNIDLVESGTVGVDTDAGLTIASNIISVNADGTSVGFDGAGAVEVKDDGITTAKILDANVTTAKIADNNVTLSKLPLIDDYKVLGNVSGASAIPSLVDILDDDTMATASANSIPTSESVKAYVDTEVGAVGVTASWVPVVTQGANTPTISVENAWYAQIGNLVTAHAVIVGTAGTSGVSGETIDVTLPVTATGNNSLTGGGGYIQDNSATKQWVVSCEGSTAGTKINFRSTNTSLTRVGNDPTFAFTTDDRIEFTITYEASL